MQQGFPTLLHEHTAIVVRDYFLTIPETDTVLVVNSCARGKAVPESDLDIAVLVKQYASAAEIKTIEAAWQVYAASQETIKRYKQSSPFAHLHVDVIDGNYIPGNIEIGEPIDYFEIEIGNHICYSAPMRVARDYFKTLQEKWLPYYDEALRLERLKAIQLACAYDIDHVPFFVRRGLHFHAFYILYKAFQEYLQSVFIANKTYPIAYNKWIREQFTEWLHLPELYTKLSPVISIRNIESNELNEKAVMLRELLDALNVT